MKINILDPGLEYKAGHHFDHDLKLARWLVAAGHDVHIYGYSKMTEDAEQAVAAVCGVTKLFTMWHYARVQDSDPYAGELILHDQQAGSVGADLKAVRNADLWLWPSMRAHHLHACALAQAKVPVVGCVHEDPGIAARTTEAQLWRLALMSAQKFALPYTVGTIEPELRHRFMPIVPDGRFPLFPQPYDGPALDAPKAALKRIGFFGYQRGEKGARHILPLLNQLIVDGYEVVFHDSNPQNQELRHPKLETLRYVDDLNVPIATCDLVVLTYNVAQYSMKGSGILAGCQSIGVPVTAPFGTLPGRLIEEAQIGPLFPALSGQAMYEAIKVAERNFPAYAGNAHRNARRFAKRNGIARFAEMFLAAGGFGQAAKRKAARAR